MKFKLDRTFYKEDETPHVKKFDPQPGVQVIEWEGLNWTLKPGVPETFVTLFDVLRTVYSTPIETETGESKSRRGQLLKKLLGANRKKVDLDLNDNECEFTIKMAGQVLTSPVTYIQLEDILKGQPTIGDDRQDFNKESLEGKEA